ALGARIERYVADRRRAGYYEAALTLTPVLIDSDRTVNLTLSVVPGPHVRLVFTGDPLPAEKRAELVPVEREGSVDEDLLEDSTRRIENYLRDRGYRDAAAPHAREESGGELLVTFAVKRGREYRVERVEISGNAIVPLADLLPPLRARVGEPFAQARLDADLATIEEVYRRRGFATAKAISLEPVPSVEPDTGPVPLRVNIVITEGPRTMVSAVSIRGNTALTEDALKQSLGLQPGGPYIDTQLVLDRDALQLRYLDLGYAKATVEAEPNFSADRTTAQPTFIVHEDVRVFVDHVLIVG